MGTSTLLVVIAIFKCQEHDPHLNNMLNQRMELLFEDLMTQNAKESPYDNENNH